jgi:VirC2 protein
MAIRKPSLSVHEARHLAVARLSAPDAVHTLPDLSEPLPANTPPILQVVAVDTSGGSLQSQTLKRTAVSRERRPQIQAKSASPRKALPLELHLEREPKHQVFLSAALPDNGFSKSFDLLCRHYPRTKALQMILRRALDNYEALLADGRFIQQALTYPYATSPECAGTIQTSRIMSEKLLEKARSFFDPLGFESDRAFGRKLAEAALAIFFEHLD